MNQTCSPKTKQQNLFLVAPKEYHFSLFDKRIVVASEENKSRKFDAELVKKLSGGDEISFKKTAKQKINE